MASEICQNSNRSSSVDFRPKGFFESRGWSRSRRSSSNPSSAENSPRAPPLDPQPAVDAPCGDVSTPDPDDDDYQFLFGRVWQTNGVTGTSPSESSSSPNPRAEEPQHVSKPSTTSSWRRYGFKRGGSGSGSDYQKIASSPSSDASPENCKVGVSNGKRFSAKGQQSPEFTTVSVGEGKGKRVLYTISSEILRHHLFQVLMKCSHGDVRDANQSDSTTSSVGNTVLISCDPALFRQLVRVVAGDGYDPVETDKVQ